MLCSRAKDKQKETRLLTFPQASVHPVRGSPVINMLSAIQAPVRHNATKQAVCASRHNASFTRLAQANSKVCLLSRQASTYDAAALLLVLSHIGSTHPMEVGLHHIQHGQTIM